MADLNSKSRELVVKKLEHQKLVALAQIHAREIRLMELEEEAERMRADIIAQRKVIVEAEKNIAQQAEEAKKEKEQPPAAEGRG
jgi:hypothetical protein